VENSDAIRVQLIEILRSMKQQVLNFGNSPGFLDTDVCRKRGNYLILHKFVKEPILFLIAINAATWQPKVLTINNC
jgi:hypothetical protein